jgi:hypothetical protein
VFRSYIIVSSYQLGNPHHVSPTSLCCRPPACTACHTYDRSSRGQPAPSRSRSEPGHRMVFGRSCQSYCFAAHFSASAVEHYRTLREDVTAILLNRDTLRAFQRGGGRCKSVLDRQACAEATSCDSTEATLFPSDHYVGLSS